MKKIDTQPRPTDIDIIPEPSHPKRSTKILNWISIAALAVIAVSLAIILKWSFAPTEVLDIRNNPFPARVVPDPTGQTGGIVFLKVDYCKNLAVNGTVRVSYVSKSREIFLPVSREQLPKGCSVDKQELPVVIPLSLLRDEYKIKFHVTYDVNPLKQNVSEDFESQPITVGTNAPN